MKIKTGLMFRVMSFGVLILNAAGFFSFEYGHYDVPRYRTCNPHLRRNRRRDFFSAATDYSCDCDAFYCNHRRGYNYHHQNNVGYSYTYENSSLFTKLLCFFAIGITLSAIIEEAIKLSIIRAIWILVLILVFKGISRLNRRILNFTIKIKFLLEPVEMFHL